MNVERSVSPSVESAAVTRPVLCAAGWMIVAGAGSGTSDQIVPAGVNSVARGGSRSAYFTARNGPAVSRVQRPKGQIERVRSHPPTGRGRAGAPRCCGSALAPTRGRGAHLVREDELGLRSGAYSSTAVRASRPVYPLHASVVGEVAGGQHRCIGDAGHPCATGGVMQRGVNDHE
jgi:hypothetical protein